MAPKVIDKDRGMKKIVRRLLALHGMDARAGVLSGVAKYPDRGQTAVAKVAGVHGVHKVMGAVFDGAEGKISASAGEATGKIIDGSKPQDVLVEILMPYRDEVREQMPVDTGLLRENIGAAAFRGKRHLAGDPREGVEFAGPGF